MEIRGIDVSHWQGNIDWERVKNGGVNFAIIKAGGSDDGFYTDSNFEKNYANAKAVGMPVGAYYFVGKDFTSTEDGVIDARMFLNIIKGKQFEYPVYVDIEITDPAQEVGVTDAAIAFCKEMEREGYFVGIYGSDLSTFDSRLENERLDAFSKWVARYGGEPQYVKNYDMWQYSSSGQVPGIYGAVDMNISHVDYTSVIKGNGFNGFTINTNPDVLPVVEIEEHRVGETVNFEGIFATSEDSEVLKPLYTTGKITSIRQGARNPYLINDGMGWVNDSVIVTPSNETTYVVQSGDSLWSIATDKLGNGQRYKEIANLNGISDPSKIYVGTTLRIPAK